MTSYISKAKEAVLNWAAESKGLERTGHFLRYGAVPVGVGSVGLAYNLGMTDAGAVSRIGLFPASLMFSAGEACLTFKEYATDRARGETSPVKNAGYFMRIAAPIYAACSLSNGIWQPISDAGGPVAAWVGEVALNELGKSRIRKQKREMAKSLGRESVLDMAAENYSDSLENAIADAIPMIKLKKEGD